MLHRRANLPSETLPLLWPDDRHWWIGKLKQMTRYYCLAGTYYGEKNTYLVNSSSMDVPFSLIVQHGRTIQSHCSVWTYHSVLLFSMDVPFSIVVQHGRTISLVVQHGRTIQSHCSAWTYHSVSLFSMDVPFSLVVQHGRTIQSRCSAWTYHSVSLFSMDVPLVSLFSMDVPFSLTVQHGRTIQSRCSAWTYHSVSLFSMDVPFSLVVQHGRTISLIVQHGRTIQSQCSVWTYHSVSLFSMDVPFSLTVQHGRTIQSQCFLVCRIPGWAEWSRKPVGLKGMPEATREAKDVPHHDIHSRTPPHNSRMTAATLVVSPLLAAGKLMSAQDETSTSCLLHRALVCVFCVTQRTAH